MSDWDDPWADADWADVPEYGTPGWQDGDAAAAGVCDVPVSAVEGPASTLPITVGPGPTTAVEDRGSAAAQFTSFPSLSAPSPVGGGGTEADPAADPDRDAGPVEDGDLDPAPELDADQLDAPSDPYAPLGPERGMVEEPPFDPDYDVAAPGDDPGSPWAPAATGARSWPPAERDDPPAASEREREPNAFERSPTYRRLSPSRFEPHGPVETYRAVEGHTPAVPHRLPHVTVIESGLLTSTAPSALLQAAELYLSLLSIIRSDAETLSAEDPFAGATSRPPVDDRGTTPEQFVGADGVRLIETYWDYVWPLRASAPSRSLAHCEGCGEHWYIPGGNTQPPRVCAMTSGCEGKVHKAYVRLTERAVQRLKERKAKGQRPGDDGD